MTNEETIGQIIEENNNKIKPFAKIHDVEKYYCQKIIVDDLGVMTVIGAERKKGTDLINVILCDDFGIEYKICSDALIKYAKYNNKPFGVIDES